MTASAKPPSLISPRLQGQLDLRFAHDAARNRTILARHSHQPPLQIIRAFDLDGGAAGVHIHNISGGVLGGDDLELRVAVEPGAQAQLTTTGATRIYRSRSDRAVAVQRNLIEVGTDGLLEYVPDPTIPFAGSRYRQTTRIDLDHGSGLFWWEIIAPGREASGEIFSYDLLHFLLDLYAVGRPIALERVRLEPQQQSLTSGVRLHGYRYFATFYICRVGLEPAQWRTLESRLAQLALDLTVPGATIWGVSTLSRHGLVVRAVSVTSRSLTSGLTAFWQHAKQELYGRAPVLPRKLS